MVTCSKQDASVRALNHLTNEAEVVHTFPGEAPFSVSLHPAGTLVRAAQGGGNQSRHPPRSLTPPLHSAQVALGFSMRIGIWHLFDTKMDVVDDLPIRDLQCLAISRRGGYLAAAAKQRVLLFHLFTAGRPKLAGEFRGHTAKVGRAPSA